MPKKFCHNFTHMFSPWVSDAFYLVLKTFVKSFFVFLSDFIQLFEDVFLAESPEFGTDSYSKNSSSWNFAPGKNDYFIFMK